MLDHCSKYESRDKPLSKQADEEAAQLLAMYRTASMASRMSKGKVSAEWLRILVKGGPPQVNKTRAANFRSRVKYLAGQLEDDFEEAKRVLLQKALEVYYEALDPKFLKRHPKIAHEAAKHVLDETHFFNGSGDNGKKTVDRKELEMKVKKILAKKKRTKNG
jgi:hypothetical protein